jgi:amidase
MRTLGDIIEYNKRHAEIAMPPRKNVFKKPGETGLLNYIAHTNQKDLIESQNSSLTANDAAEAYREINRKAGKDGMDKYMRENNVDIIVSNSDCTLVIWAACAGE